MRAMPRPSFLILRATAVALLAAWLAGCGQKGPLFIPATPAAAQRATLPQTLFNPSTPTPAASRAPAAVPPPALPNLPDIQ